MFKGIRNRVRKMGGNFGLTVLRLAFLITFGLWVWGMYSPADGIVDLVVEAILSVILAAFTFEWVALGMLILCIPVRLLINLVQGD